MTKLLSIAIAAMFAAVSVNAIAASHAGAPADKKMEKKDKMEKKGEKKAKAKMEKKDKMDKKDAAKK